MHIRTHYHFTIVICLIVIQILGGCTAYAPSTENTSVVVPTNVIVHNTYSHQVRMNQVPQGVQGTKGIGFVRPADRDVPISQRPQTRTLHILKPGKIQLFLLLMNNTSVSKTFLVSTILDYQQITFSLDSEDGLLHQVTVPPHTELDVPFEVVIDVGDQHDLQVIAFDDPYNADLSLDYRQDPYGYIIARRANIRIETDHPARNLTYTPSTAIPSDLLLFNVMFLKEQYHNRNTENRYIYTDTVQLHNPYTLHIGITNREEQAGDYVLLPFVDYKQQSFTTQDVYMVHLNPHEAAVIDTTIVLDELGIHQFQLVWLINPYTDLTEDTATPPFVFGSSRLAFIVR